MTSKRLFAGNEKLPYFASLSFERDDCKKDIATDLTANDQLMRDRKPKHRPSSVIERFLDSLKLSPKLRGKSGRTDVDCNMAKTSDGRSITSHFAPESYKHATIWTTDSRCSDTSETCDSLSDSMHSQSSDASEVRSQNTTSTDSENNRTFKQDTPYKDPKSLDNNGSPVMDEDEGFLRKVLMLIKVILFLRHKFSLNIIRRSKVARDDVRLHHGKFRDSSSLSSCESGDSNGSCDFCSRKTPRTRKRISFSPITLLFSAITERAYDEAKAVLEEQELDVNFKTPSGQSLLHIAAANADLRCVQLLLQYGANVNIKDTDGWGPLHAAVTKGNWKCVILLIEAGAEFGKYAQERIYEYNQVQQIATTFSRSLEIYV